MFNNFFTPEEISPRKDVSFRSNYAQSYDFSSLLQKDLFQIVSPHVQSILDQKRKIITWLKRISLPQRMHILTYTNKQFVCLIRAMYQKKQPQYQHESSVFFTISHIPKTDEFDLMSTTNNKKLSKEYIAAEDELLKNIKIMSRYTQFDSITFSDYFIRNVDAIFHQFDLLGDGISHQLTQLDYQRLKKMHNSTMFYDSNEQHCYKKATIGTWITEVFMKDISMKYLQLEIDGKINFHNEFKQKSKQFEKYWKIITPERKNEIIKRVLLMKPIDLYQQHRLMIKVTRNGFPPIQKSDKVPFLLKSIMNANQKQIFDILTYTNLSQTLESHSILKYYLAQQLESEIQKYNELQQNLSRQAKMKKKKKKNKPESQIQIQKKVSENSIKTLQKDQQKKQTFQIYKDTTKQNKKQVYVKGTDLFYKKLEISQTQSIICFEGNFEEKSQSKQQKVRIEENTSLQIKPKNKNKNKKRNKEKGDINKIQEKYSVEDKQQFEQDLKEQKKYSKEKIDQQQNFRKFSQNNLSQIDRNSQKSSQTTNDPVQEPREENIDKKQKKQEAYKILIENNFFDDPLSHILKEMQKTITFFNKQRKIVVNRLSYIFAHHELSFKVYGSSSCQLALPSSDIDIVVDPSIVNYFYFSYSNYRKKIINSLEYLQKVFEKFQWAQDFILLPGATIPLLSFTVNPSIDFDFQQGNYQYNNKKPLKQEIRISVDITVESYVNMTDEIPMHLGIQSTQIIKEWNSIFPFYGQLLLLLKIFAKNQNLNKMYHGGISSFMQGIILAGFYKNFFMSLTNNLNDFEYKKQKFQEILPTGFNISKMFSQYCLFIHKFNQDKQVLDINSINSISIKPQSVPKEQLAIVNPLTGKIMSERCTTFAQYKKILMKIYEILNSQDNNIKQQLKILFSA